MTWTCKSSITWTLVAKLNPFHSTVSVYQNSYLFQQYTLILHHLNCLKVFKRHKYICELCLQTSHGWNPFLLLFLCTSSDKWLQTALTVDQLTVNRHVNGKMIRYVWRVIVIFSRLLYLKLNTLQTLHCSSTAFHNEVNTLSYRSVSHCMGMKLTNLREQLARAFHGMFVTIYTFHFGNGM